MMMQQQQQQPQVINMATLEAMRRQERHYMCCDYLYQSEHQQNSRRFRLMNLPQNGINIACRTSMLQWMKTVVNFIGFESEIVDISMSTLDRFLQTAAGQDAIHCRTIYQLTAMTALYLSVKINCAEALTPKLLAELSQGSYEAEQFENMERLMLEALQWHVNPPTAGSFVRETVEQVLPQSLFATEEIQQAVIDTACIQAEWAIGDYELLTVKKSVVAFAAVANALTSQKIRGFRLQTFLLEQEMMEGKRNSLDLDLKQASLIQKALREALPEVVPAEDLDESSTALLSNDDNGSIKSIDEDNTNEEASLKSIAVGRSPRSVTSRVA